jgi:hypothetical protein
VNSAIVPTVKFSVVISGAVPTPFSKIPKENQVDGEARFQKHGRDDLCREYCGVATARSIEGMINDDILRV